MPYLGNTAGNRFVASKAATQFSGNGSNTSFTLEHAVGSDEDILVSVDGVIQEPSVAYSVSNGTTLTFTAAPSNNSGNNIFVYYLFRTVGTVDHPATSSLQATDGTFSSTLGVTGASTLTGALSAKGGVVFNEDSADVDFRVESNTIDDALFVQGSDGFVGIGTQSPSSPLDIEYIDGGVQLKIGRTNTTAGSAWFGADANALNIGVGAYGSAGGNVTTPNGIKVSSGGIVSKPYQPSVQFQGGYAGNQTIDYNEVFGATNDSQTAFNVSSGQTHSRTGISYASATGRFTVSTEGIYLVYFQAYHNDGTPKNVRCSIYKNGVRQSLGHTESLSYGTVHVNASLLCGANDYIYFRYETNATTNFYMGTDHLIGYITKVA